MRSLKTRKNYDIQSLNSPRDVNDVLRDFSNDVFGDFNEYYKVWEDLQFETTAYRLHSPGGAITYDYDLGAAVFKKTSDVDTDYVMQIIQVPHKWAQGSELRPHIHWLQNNTGTPPWRIKYRWYNNGEVLPSFSSALPPEEVFAFKYTSGNMLQISKFPSIKAEGKGTSSFLDIRISRDGQGGVNGDIYLKQFDIHFLCDSNGSRDEYIKEA